MKKVKVRHMAHNEVLAFIDRCEAGLAHLTPLERAVLDAKVKARVQTRRIYTIDELLAVFSPRKEQAA